MSTVTEGYKKIFESWTNTKSSTEVHKLWTKNISDRDPLIWWDLHLYLYWFYFHSIYIYDFNITRWSQLLELWNRFNLCFCTWHAWPSFSSGSSPPWAVKPLSPSWNSCERCQRMRPGGGPGGWWLKRNWMLHCVTACSPLFGQRFHTFIFK